MRCGSRDVYKSRVVLRAPRRAAASTLRALSGTRMSTATILSPPALNLMAGRRVPLASIPQVINSPNRVAPVAGAKRSRPLNVDLRDLPHGQLPPAKRQQRDADDLRRQAMLKKPAGPTALQRKLEAAKSTRQSPQKGSQKTQKADEQSLDNIRQWQQHYKKVFPKLVVYFESVPDDARAKISRQIQSLGAVRIISCRLYLVACSLTTML